MNSKPFLYTLIGLLTGGAVTALIVLPTIKPSQQNSQAQTVLSQVVPSPRTTVVPARGSMMGQSDQHFIVMMIPHHDGAVAMADLALSRAKHLELKTLAQTIKTTQTQEIQQMRTWYKQWYGTDVPVWSPGNRWGWYGRNQAQPRDPQQPVWGPGMMGGAMMHRGMMGSNWMGTNVYALQNASDFDREFIQQMIPHHQMGVMMAQMVLNSSQHPEIRNLAQSIITGQTAEINQMQQWYQEWYQ